MATKQPAASDAAPQTPTAPAVTLLDDGSPAAAATGALLSASGVTWERHALNTAEALDTLALEPLLALVRALPADLRDVALPLTAAARAIPEAHANAQPHSAIPLFSGVAPLFVALHHALTGGGKPGMVIAPFVNETVAPVPATPAPTEPTAPAVEAPAE